MDVWWPLHQRGTRGAALPYHVWLYWHYAVLLPPRIKS